METLFQTYPLHQVLQHRQSFSKLEHRLGEEADMVQTRPVFKSQAHLQAKESECCPLTENAQRQNSSSSEANRKVVADLLPKVLGSLLFLDMLHLHDLLRMLLPSQSRQNPTFTEKTDEGWGIPKLIRVYRNLSGVLIKICLQNMVWYSKCKVISDIFDHFIGNIIRG